MRKCAPCIFSRNTFWTWSFPSYPSNSIYIYATQTRHQIHTHTGSEPQLMCLNGFSKRHVVLRRLKLITQRQRLHIHWDGILLSKVLWWLVGAYLHLDYVCVRGWLPRDVPLENGVVADDGQCFGTKKTHDAGFNRDTFDFIANACDIVHINFMIRVPYTAFWNVCLSEGTHQMDIVYLQKKSMVNIFKMVSVWTIVDFCEWKILN